MTEKTLHPTSHPEQTLLVIGAGPKAISLAAKRFVLSSLGFSVPQLRILDAKGLVASWSGAHGFTDGEQLLGTRPEKDIGFPYGSTCWDHDATRKSLAREMLRFSWQSYLVQQGLYAPWIDRGRTRPTHGEWASYLTWVAEQVNIPLLQTRVMAISQTPDEQRWQLTCQNNAGEVQTIEGDGLVLTGPGRPTLLPGQPLSHPRVYDGETFWSSNEEMLRFSRTSENPVHVGVVGTGETAAAIVVSLLHTLKNRVFIEVISPNGMLYSRDEGFEENRLFSDPDASFARLNGLHEHSLNWLRMTETDRRAFLRRTDRGVFSLQTMEEVNRSENVRTMMGTARSMLPLEEQVILDIAYDTTIEQDRYDYVVVATGFDPLWFSDLMDEASQQKYFFREGKMPDRTSIERTIERDLSVQSLSPRLHLPMLAGTSQGPGFPNLSCLGLLSDRILASYHHKE